MTPSEIEPATFPLVKQCLNQMRHPVPPLLFYITKYVAKNICVVSEDAKKFKTIGKKHSDSENFILTSMCTRHIFSTWHIPDPQVAAIHRCRNTYPTVVPRIVALRRRNASQVSVTYVLSACVTNRLLTRCYLRG